MREESSSSVQQVELSLFGREVPSRIPGALRPAKEKLEPLARLLLSVFHTNVAPQEAAMKTLTTISLCSCGCRCGAHRPLAKARSAILKPR